MVVPWRSSNFRGEVMRITSRTSLPALLLDELQPPIEVVQSLGSIPIPPTSFVGRESEIADLIALLQRSDVKLITVTGPGGVGKTRLTIRVAEQLRDTFEDGVWFVMLAPVRDPALVPVAIAHVLGLRTSERNVGMRSERISRLGACSLYWTISSICSKRLRSSWNCCKPWGRHDF